MTDSAQHPSANGFDSLPRDLTADELDHAPAVKSVDALLIEDLTDEEADAFYAALDA